MGDITSPNGVWSQGVFTAKDGTKYEGERAVLADAPSLGDLLRGLFGGAKPAGNVPLPPKRPAGLGATRMSEVAASAAAGVPDERFRPIPTPRQSEVAISAGTPDLADERFVPLPGPRISEAAASAGAGLADDRFVPLAQPRMSEAAASGGMGNDPRFQPAPPTFKMNPASNASAPFTREQITMPPALQVFNRRNRVMR
jgi:hypothetical protein